MIELLDPLSIARVLMGYTVLDAYRTVASTLLASAILSSLTVSESEEKRKESELIAKALMLPYPVKSMKVEGNKVIIEIGEES